jgi:adenylosuccinate lyase
MNPFDAASPLDARYYLSDPDLYARLHPYVSEAAQIRYLAQVEAALVATFAELGLCPPQAAQEVAAAAAALTAEEVYAEERRIQHNIRALVNCLRRRVSPAVRPYVHLFATSADIIDTARALCLREVAHAVLLPDLAALLRQLITEARAHADTVQIGRTHGQHAVPITFGFALALYVSRLGERLEKLVQAVRGLRGKLAGAVGAYNALSLYRPQDPEEVEARLLQRLGLPAAEIASQIVPPEPVLDYVYALLSLWGVLANLADDFRHLQRSEIRELRDRQASDPASPVVGSSTMPHKINPKDFENVKSMWKAYVPRLLTAALDQISEHQRDLTNSASGRFVTELVAAFACSVQRLRQALEAVVPDTERMRQIVEEGKGRVAAEPLYILLALAGHPDAHEQARRLSRLAEQQHRPLLDLLSQEKDLAPYLERLAPWQRALLEDPARYVGSAAQRTRAVCDAWEARLRALERAWETSTTAGA